MPDIARDLVDRVKATLTANGASSDTFSYLAAGIDADDLTLTAVVASGALGVDVGVVEIDSELLYLQSVDSGGTCTVAPYIGRGFNHTTATSHATGAMVTSAPKVPRRDVLRALNDALSDTFPQLFAVTWVPVVGDGETTEFTTDAALRVVAAEVYDDVVAEWLPLKDVRLTQPQYTGGDSVLVMPYTLGVDVQARVAVASPPIPFDTESTSVEDHGVPVDIGPLLVTAALLKLTPGPELARMQTDTVEANDRSRTVPASAGLTASRYLQLVYEGQLRSARDALLARYPIQTVRTGRARRVTRSW